MYTLPPICSLCMKKACIALSKQLVNTSYTVKQRYHTHFEVQHIRWPHKPNKALSCSRVEIWSSWFIFALFCFFPNQRWEKKRTKAESRERDTHVVCPSRKFPIVCTCSFRQSLSALELPADTNYKQPRCLGIRAVLSSVKADYQLPSWYVHKVPRNHNTQSKVAALVLCRCH